jgi:Mrp family chromosome partitioning ATPase
MSNIYEALRQAQQEKKTETPLIALPEDPAERIPRSAVHIHRETRFNVETELHDLYQNISGLLPDTSGKIIQFIGSREGEGVSTIVREFAREAAARFNRRVLILDAAHRNPTQHLHFNIKGNFGWRDVLGSGDPLRKACYQAGNDNLFLSPTSPAPTLTPRIHDHAAAVRLFNELKQAFDLIVIDSSPATTSPDSVAMTRFADGVILVLEAEKTRWQVVESVKNRIIKNGGNILGVIFNKRRFYIPESIYSRL